MEDVQLPELSPETVNERFDPRTSQRGSDYANRGMVEALELSASSLVEGPIGQERTSSLYAEVAGSQGAQYSTKLTVVEYSDGRASDIVGATCACPVGLMCKHAAAIAWLLTPEYRQQRVHPGPAVSGSGTVGQAAPETEAAIDNLMQWAQEHGLDMQFADALAGGMRTDSSAPARLAPPAVPQAPKSTWRQELGALRWIEADETLVPVAIQFELRPKPVRNWWGQELPDSFEPEDAAADPEMRVAMRLMRPGKRNNWIKGGLSWRSLTNSAQTSKYKHAQTDVLARIYRLYSAEHEGYGSNGEVLGIEQFTSTLVWDLLQEAQAAGVVFLPAGFIGDVGLGEPVTAFIDVRQPSGGDRGDLVLEPTVRPRPAGGVHTIGGVGIGEFVTLGDTDAPARGRGRTGPSHALTLHPLSEPLTPAVRHMFLREPVRIGAEDSQEFFADYYPRILPQVDLDSTDDSVVLPEPARPKLLAHLRYGAKDRLTIDWEFDYPGHVGPVPLEFQEGAGRDRAFEAEVVARVRLLDGDLAVTGHQSLEGVATAAFTHLTLPKLERTDDVAVMISGNRPAYQQLQAEPHISVTADKVDKHDWLDLGFEITVEGRTIPFPTLFKALAQGKDKLLLVDKSFFSLRHPAFEKLRNLLTEADALDEWDPEAPKMAKHQVAFWDELDDIADESHADEDWLESIAGLRDITAIEPVAVPAGLKAELRDYQQAGFQWLAFLHAHKLGGILADDMGLGKTMQTLALIAHAVESRGEGGAGAPFLVVAPASVTGVWQQEAARFTPDLNVVHLGSTTGKRKTLLADAITGADLVITSYTILRIDQAEFADTAWSGLVLDEAQFVKNQTAQVHQAAAWVPADFKLAITGTPMENSLTDLWALLNIAEPGLLASARRFRDHYVKPIESGENPTRMASLRARVRPFMLRRTKEQVAADLPAKQEQTVSVELVPKHRRLYDAVLQRERKKILGLVDDLDKNRFIVFRSLTLLRMLALDPAIVDPQEYADVPSSKLDELSERLGQVIEEGHRVLVFSQFTSFLHRVAGRLEHEGIAYSYLDGATRARSQVIEDFRSGDQPVFLISLKSGGFGLTLTEADYVFLLDPWWNPAAEAQAIDRVHRIGQSNSVMVYRMVADGTIEQKVLALQQKKAELFSSLMDNETAFSSDITPDDIRQLFEPGA